MRGDKYWLSRLNVRKNHNSQVGQHSSECTLRHFTSMSSEHKGEITEAKFMWGNGGEAINLKCTFNSLRYEASD